MYRVTRKQLIRQGGNVIELTDATECDECSLAEKLASSIRTNELAFGSQPYGPNKVEFDAPTFYRSVTVTIEEIS